MYKMGRFKNVDILTAKESSAGYIETKIYSTHLNIYKFEGTIILHL